MHFHLDDEQLALRDAVRDFCRARTPLAGVADREGRPAAPELWQGLAELGVLGILEGLEAIDAIDATEGHSGVDSECDGADVGIVEAAIVFEELGIHLVGGPLLWSTLGAPWVEGVAIGSVRVAGVDLGDGLNGPLVIEHAAEADVVVALYHDRVELIERPAFGDGFAGSPLDPLTPTTVFTSVPSGTVIGDAAAARQLRRLGTVLSAALLVGVAQGALDVARTYALEREQFGVPIGSFQAVKHLLADMYVRLELARAESQAAAALTADPLAGDPDRAASAAKLLAGEAAIANARTAIQVLGGMGFTWDMLPHYYLKRAWVLEHTFGTASAHAAWLGAAVGAESAENAESTESRRR